MNVVDEVKRIEKDIISWRRDLHRIPEYDFKLYKTSQYIQKKLKDFDIDFRIAAETGIIATIYGSEVGPTIGLRADMDALPIKEETNLPFSSENKGYMHACGHDAHMAMLLGVARILSENRNKLKGNVRLIFQPAEETTGGAKVMIEEGCLQEPKVDSIIGLHIGNLFEEIKNGQIGFKYGGMMASVDSFSVEVKGKGGHGARPHESIDPILTVVEMITSIQKIISREVNPSHPIVINVGTVNGGTAPNIVPEIAKFTATVRTIYPEDRLYVEKRIREIVLNIASSNRCKAIVEYSHFYPSVINDHDCTQKLKAAAKQIAGEDKVVEISEPSMGAEDMSYYLNEVPGTFFILGSVKNAEDKTIYPHHNAKFDIDEDVLWTGTATFIQYIYNQLFVDSYLS